VIQVQAVLPGASPETMASAWHTARASIRTHRGVTEMTSTSLLGASTVVLQFDLNRNIDAAARDVQPPSTPRAASFPRTCPNNPSYARSTRPTRPS